MYLRVLILPKLPLFAKKLMLNLVSTNNSGVLSPSTAFVHLLIRQYAKFNSTPVYLTTSLLYLKHVDCSFEQHLTEQTCLVRCHFSGCTPSLVLNGLLRNGGGGKEVGG